MGNVSLTGSRTGNTTSGLWAPGNTGNFSPETAIMGIFGFTRGAVLAGGTPGKCSLPGICGKIPCTGGNAPAKGGFPGAGKGVAKGGFNPGAVVGGRIGVGIPGDTERTGGLMGTGITGVTESPGSLIGAISVGGVTIPGIRRVGAEMTGSLTGEIIAGDVVITGAMSVGFARTGSLIGAISVGEGAITGALGVGAERTGSLIGAASTGVAVIVVVGEVVLTVVVEIVGDVASVAAMALPAKRREIAAATATVILTSL